MKGGTPWKWDRMRNGWGLYKDVSMVVAGGLGSGATGMSVYTKAHYSMTYTQQAVWLFVVTDMPVKS